MAQISQFAFGPVTPVLALGLSCAGSLLGLHCASRARGTTGRVRAAWLGLAALSIGGAAVWGAHVLAMLGFRIDGVEIRYDVNLTVLSAVAAVVVVGVGLFIVGFAERRPLALLGAGVVTGLGLASVHYLGMLALNTDGHVDYKPLIVAASVAIAVVAATVALWFSMRVHGHWVSTGAALVMGLAITGVHYTGMAALQVRDDQSLALPPGVRAFDLLLPLIVSISVIGVLLMVAIGLSLGDEERTMEKQFDRQLAERAAGIRTYFEPEPRQAQDSQRGSWS